MRFAYADPPYPGCGKRYKERREVDYKELIARLNTFDGWALSCHSPGLRKVLPLCPPSVRVGAWVKPFAVFKPNVNPAYTWEPVIFWNCRNHRPRTEPTVRDWLQANITFQRGLVGAKPKQFARWVFLMLGMRKGDTLDDLYPGTGIITEALREWDL